MIASVTGYPRNQWPPHVRPAAGPGCAGGRCAWRGRRRCRPASSAKGAGDMRAGLAGDRADPGQPGEGLRVGETCPAVPDLGQQPGGAQCPGAGQGREDVRVGMGGQLDADRSTSRRNRPQTRKDQPIRAKERTSSHRPGNDQPQFRCGHAADLRQLTSRSPYCRFPAYLGRPPGSSGPTPAAPLTGRQAEAGEDAVREAGHRLDLAAPQGKH
jgi:hypothetical protein